MSMQQIKAQGGLHVWTVKFGEDKCSIASSNGLSFVGFQGGRDLGFDKQQCGLESTRACNNTDLRSVLVWNLCCCSGVILNALDRDKLRANMPFVVMKLGGSWDLVPHETRERAIYFGVKKKQGQFAGANSEGELGDLCTRAACLR